MNEFNRYYDLDEHDVIMGEDLEDLYKTYQNLKDWTKDIRQTWSQEHIQGYIQKMGVILEKNHYDLGEYDLTLDEYDVIMGEDLEDLRDIHKGLIDWTDFLCESWAKDHIDAYLRKMGLILN